MDSNSIRALLKPAKTEDSNYSTSESDSLVAYTDIHSESVNAVDGSSINRAISISNTTDFALLGDRRGDRRTNYQLSASLPNGTVDLQSMVQYVDSFTFSLKQTLTDQFTSSQQRQTQQWESHVTEILKQYEELDGNQKDEIAQLRQELQETQSKLTTTREENIQITERNRNLEHRVKSQVQLSQALSKWRRDCERLEFINGYMDHIIIPQERSKRLRRIFNAWYGMYLRGYKERNDKLWNSRLEQISRKLIADYESALQKTRTEKTDLRKEVDRLNSERQHIESNMKRAFMRGVSALNLEAMSLFQGHVDASRAEHAEPVEDTRKQDDFEPRARLPARQQ